MTQSKGPSQLQKSLREALKKAADPARAPLMRAYMKSEMPFYGIQSKPLSEICRNIFSSLSFKDQKEWEQVIRKLWDEAKFREERYAAIRLCEHRSGREFQNLETVKLYEHMIATGAWWDFVDPIAGHYIGEILKKYPKKMKPLMLKWSHSPNMWIRRAAILSQLGFKKDTDLALLYACIEPSIESREFFLRKAIGWALRQYAWTNPKEIQRYVRENKHRLSGLSQREALKNVNRSKNI